MFFVTCEVILQFDLNNYQIYVKAHVYNHINLHFFTYIHIFHYDTLNIAIFHKDLSKLYSSYLCMQGLTLAYKTTHAVIQDKKGEEEKGFYLIFV